MSEYVVQARRALGEAEDEHAAAEQRVEELKSEVAELQETCESSEEHDVVAFGGGDEEEAFGDDEQGMELDGDAGQLNLAPKSRELVTLKFGCDVPFTELKPHFRWAPVGFSRP